MIISKCFERRCLRVVSVTHWKKPHKPFPRPTSSNWAPALTKHGGQNLSISGDLRTTILNLPCCKLSFTVDVSLCVSRAIVVPSFERIDPLTWVYSSNYDWFGTKKVQDPPPTDLSSISSLFCTDPKYESIKSGQVAHLVTPSYWPAFVWKKWTWWQNILMMKFNTRSNLNYDQ